MRRGRGFALSDQASQKVFAFGADAAPAAGLYAELTGRRSGGIVRRVEEIDPARFTVLVTTTSRISPALLDALYPADARHGPAPGLIVAADATELERRVRAIAAQVRREPAGPVTELYPLAQFDDVSAGGRRVLGALAPAERVREALNSDSPLVSVLTHSNGFDAMLPGSLVLCNASTPDGRAIEGAPCCQMTGQCYRTRLPMRDAIASGRLVRAEEVHGRILFLCTCCGILTPGEGIDPAWGYTDGLIASGHHAAIITSWTVTLPTAASQAELLHPLYRGATAGEAVAAFNQRDDGVRLAVLGDPDVRIPPLPGEVVGELRYEAPHEPLPGDGGRFLSALTYAAALEAEGEQQERAAAANDLLRAFEHAAGLGLPTSGESEIGTAMHEAVMAFMAGGGSLISQHWLPMTMSRQRATEPCDGCGGPAGLFEYGFRQVGLPPRALLICPVCGLRRDAPAGSQLTLSRRGRTFGLNGPLPSRDWTALLHFGCQDRRLSTHVPWPADQGGTPARSFTPPGPWPPGPLSVALILLHGAELTVVTTGALGGAGASGGD